MSPAKSSQSRPSTLFLFSSDDDDTPMHRLKRRRVSSSDEDSSEVEIVDPPKSSPNKVLVGPVRQFSLLKLLNILSYNFSF